MRQVKDECLEVVELIETKWTNGKSKKLEDDDLNKEYLGMELKKKSI
jgi:hypothetical protein